MVQLFESNAERASRFLQCSDSLNLGRNYAAPGKIPIIPRVLHGPYEHKIRYSDRRWPQINCIPDIIVSTHQGREMWRSYLGDANVVCLSFRIYILVQDYCLDLSEWYQGSGSRNQIPDSEEHELLVSYKTPQSLLVSQCNPASSTC